MQLPNTTQLFLEALEALVPALPHPAPAPHFNPVSKLCSLKVPRAAAAAAAVGRAVTSMDSILGRSCKTKTTWKDTQCGEGLAARRSPTLFNKLLHS